MGTVNGDKIMAVDPAFRHTGVVVYTVTPDADVLVEASHFAPKPPKGKRTGRVAVENAEMVGKMAACLIGTLKTHQIRYMVVELPHGGAQSSTAMRAMAYASAMIATLVTAYNLDVEYYTPTDIKVAGAGDPEASKAMMMGAAVTGMGADICARFNKGEWEHVADAWGAFMSCKRGGIYRRLKAPVGELEAKP